MINPGDNVVFLDLMYATWDEDERNELDAVIAAADRGLVGHRLAEIERYSMFSGRDTGDEDDGHAKRKRALLAEFERQFGHTVVNRPAWLDG